MDANTNCRKRERPHDDEEKAGVSSNRQRPSLVNGLPYERSAGGGEVASQFLTNQADQVHLQLQLLNAAFQMQQQAQQSGRFAANPNSTTQQSLRLNANPFAGLQGLQVHPTAAAPATADLIATLRARLVAGGNVLALGGFHRSLAALPTNATSISSLAPSNPSQASPVCQVSTAASSLTHPLSRAGVSVRGIQEAASTSVDQQGSKDDHAMAILQSCPDDLKLLYTPADDWKLSPYQCLARRQIELFEASEKDLEAGAQGRNRPIVLVQLGIRCRWCANQPSRQRQRASAYYPSQLSGIYQAAQNITNSHLSRLCQSVPPVIREELIRLQAKKSGAGGGKKYWSQSARDQGVYGVEDGGLRFRSSLPTTEESPPGDPQNGQLASTSASATSNS